MMATSLEGAINQAVDAMRVTARMFDLPSGHVLTVACRALSEADDESSRGQEMVLGVDPTLESAIRLLVAMFGRHASAPDVAKAIGMDDLRRSKVVAYLKTMAEELGRVEPR